MDIKSFMIHSFQYEEFISENEYHEPMFGEPVEVVGVRIDDSYSWKKNADEGSSRDMSVVFYYEGISSPDIEFRTQSRITIDGRERTLVKVIPVSLHEIVGYELEVI